MISFNGCKTASPIYAIIGLAAIICVTTIQAELRQVNVVFRHGDRTPDIDNEGYPNDPYLNFSYAPMGRGQLTNQGKRREYQLGKIMLERYGGFIGNTYTPKSVSGLSSDYDRTKMSLQLVLASLFPPSKQQRWNYHLNWQPIPARYLLRIEDNIFLADECPLYLAEYDRVLRSPQGKSGISNYKDFMRQLTEWTGKNISTPLDMYYIYHTLMAEYSFGLTLPEWAYKIFPYGELWNATVFSYDIASSTPLLRRLYAGPYLLRVTRTMLDFVTGTSENERLMYLYSGHETNIAAVLHALQVYKPHVPEYSSAVFMELHEIDSQYYVKVAHYLGIPSKVEEVQLPNCDLLCPLDKYLQLTEELMPSKEELVCDKGLTKKYADEKSPEELDLTRYNLIRTARAYKTE
ncbi:PREDICTED: venom acid phosphatase Acph-1-like [Dufourea novaeangliae]|uniref:acid phosphatase n=1 Tax=Dufourea novaeangliae TaxID=178035 RepID=A0A154PK09_DUFNO|nr:PREDICTED: venom acid phosphatase Acph-1-like [Dufourea novaeangliae]KZC12199.1 Venom acid phosphatase Acph-1 [Dufourea novaeangliae]